VALRAVGIGRLRTAAAQLPDDTIENAHQCRF
jgi:hypothetical protein